jgi:hypothetical protein
VPIDRERELGTWLSRISIFISFSQRVFTFFYSMLLQKN